MATSLSASFLGFLRAPSCVQTVQVYLSSRECPDTRHAVPLLEDNRPGCCTMFVTSILRHIALQICSAPSRGQLKSSPVIDRHRGCPSHRQDVTLLLSAVALSLGQPPPSQYRRSGFAWENLPRPRTYLPGLPARLPTVKAGSTTPSFCPVDAADAAGAAPRQQRRAFPLPFSPSSSKPPAQSTQLA